MVKKCAVRTKLCKIDESMSQGKRKNNCGKLHLRDHKLNENEESSIYVYNQNYGQRIQRS